MGATCHKAHKVPSCRGRSGRKSASGHSAENLTASISSAFRNSPSVRSACRPSDTHLLTEPDAFKKILAVSFVGYPNLETKNVANRRRYHDSSRVRLLSPH